MSEQMFNIVTKKSRTMKKVAGKQNAIGRQPVAACGAATPLNGHSATKIESVLPQLAWRKIIYATAAAAAATNSDIDNIENFLRFLILIFIINFIKYVTICNIILTHYS